MKEPAASRPSDVASARLPQRKALGSNRRSCAFKRGNRCGLGLNYGPVVAAVGPLPAFGSLRQSISAREDRLRSPSARDRPSLAQRSFALKPTQLQLSRGKRFCDSTRSSCSARLALAIKSLQPLPELFSAACLRRNRHSQPSTSRRPARASSGCVTSAHVSLGVV